MAAVFYNDNPTTTDVVLFNLVTTDLNAVPIDPYKVNTVIIYFIERGFTVENVFQYTKSIGSALYTEYFKEAIPVAIYGDEDNPAWIGTDIENAFITKIDEDESGNPLVGTFRLEWRPKLAREGDYLLCFQWTPVPAGDTISNNISFYLYADTRQTASVPSHYTKPEKYETLLERYQPEMFSLMLGASDLTPDVLNRFNKALAKGFTVQEDQANQIVDLLDANAVNETLLPYLGNFFGLRLAGSDTTLWRKQIKRAVPLAKSKGTLGALIEALLNADMRFKKFTRLWQVVSPSTWQEGFVITAAQEAQSDPITFDLAKVALLPIVSTDNFEVWIRYNGDSSYTQLTTDYVSFENTSNGTVMTWVGDNLSVDPVSLSEGDVVRVVYMVSEPDDQDIENYIRDLPLADLRDEVKITFPLKNWNVRVIAEDDPMFDVIITDRHPFHYPVIFGKIRTEFPYSENIYNMEEYNGSTRDSANPCDLDKTFLDSCSSCIGSKFTIDIEIEDLSAERIEEANDIIKNFIPFHAIIHSVNFSGSKNEFIPSPVEEIEVLGTVAHEDHVTATQMNFNRIIEDGASDANELKRSMLADTSATAHSGTGRNVAITMFSPGIQFDTLSFTKKEHTYLEILSGTDQGEYQVEAGQRFTIDIVQGQPDTINWPLDTSGFPYRLSNLLFEGMVDITQRNDARLEEANITYIDYGTADDWSVVITAGLYAGTYAIDHVNPDNTISIVGFPTTSTISGLSYELRNASSQVRYTGTAGVVRTTSIGIVDFGLNGLDLGIRSGDYVKYSSVQYKVLGVDEDAYIADYSGGTVIGTASIKVYRRMIDNAVGYLEIRGMKITGTVPTIDYTAEDNKFKENYLILIGTNYYQIDSVDGSDMYLNGPQLSWGLTGTSVSYSIVQFIKTSPITTQQGEPWGGALQFDRLDRRGNDAFWVETEIAMPMGMRAAMLNNTNKGHPMEVVTQQEQIWFNIEYKE